MDYVFVPINKEPQNLTGANVDPQEQTQGKQTKNDPIKFEKMKAKQTEAAQSENEQDSSDELHSEAEAKKNFCKESRPSLHYLSARQYLDQTVAPILLQGLHALDQLRPEDPIFFLAAFLMKNKSRCTPTEQ